MARPRSILGLLFHLAALHVRRSPVRSVAAAGAVLAAALWLTRGDRAAAPAALQVGVLRDGFVSTQRDGAGRRVIELERDGRARRTMTVRHGDDQRVVGTSTGTAVAWQQGKKIRLVRVEDDREIGTWGKAARQLCDGVASNDARFAVGWLEADDSVWIVHGPVAGSGAATAELTATAVGIARNQWCGVASAEQNVTLFWRDADRLQFTFCTRRRCSALHATFRLDRRLPILGFGCVSNACLIAVRDEAGTARLAFLTETGKTKWVVPLDTASSEISIIGIGDAAFAVGHATKAGAEVIRIDRSGATAVVWRDAASTGSPALAWSSGRLLVAHHHGAALVHDTIPLPE
ncbi:MAG: hypothetical protein E6J90_14650 [Deltaproteobacteria bacterium]|nr:MAG: hypothetical protein E6J91_47250 [Deltaproteobacteria bacterium]TMQ21194.1 MAG: hypothetical protein E6J90_14650 [Deltaproteobacteria bacterium]